MITVNPVTGVSLHAVGAILAATCFAPQKKVTSWSWQSYWMTQTALCWLILPITVAMLVIPDLFEVLREAPKDAMLYSFFFGTFYGVGGTAFGLAIKAIGFSLTYAIAIGLSGVLGTLIPPLVRGELGAILAKPGSGWIVAGIVVGIIGIGVTGVAGRLKEKDLSKVQNEQTEFFLLKGLLLSVLAGSLSAVYGFSIEAGAPIAKVAEAHGGGVLSGTVIYIFSNSGAFLTSWIYCLYLHKRDNTLGELTSINNEGSSSSLVINYVMATITGVFWYGQFFFYAAGHSRMGAAYGFSSWGIHMIMLVLFSNIVGILFKEWKNCNIKTYSIVGMALLILAASVVMLTYGNYLGDIVNSH